MKDRSKPAYYLLLCLLVAWPAWHIGCIDPKADVNQNQDEAREIPSPIDTLLPHKIDFHPFTEAGIRQLDDAGGLRGIETRIRAFDLHGDTTKAFGQFRVELYAYRPDAVDHKGKKGPTWEIDLMDAEVNNLHWDEISRAYKFLLQWDNAIPVGQRYVLHVTLSSPWTARKFAEKVFVAGE